MLIECLVKREGVTPMSIGKQVYNFMPIPTFDEKGKRVAVTTSFCDVTSEEHLKYMLSKPGQFREYVPTQGSPLRAEFNPMDGYSIDKFKDSFIVTDKKKNLYAGSDGKWVKDREKVSPFLSMTDAFEWLKGETAFDAMEAGAAGG
ncbi:MAG: hypothetical protein WCV62_05735 [Candidatus Peribacteraceae bacterium]|jgi:hypothetical protein